MRAEGGDPLDARQQAAADAGAKAMMPFDSAQGRPSDSAQGRPFLDYVLHALADAGCREAALVLRPDQEEARAYYRNLKTMRIAVSFVEQQEPRGTADAVLAAEAWAGAAPFLTLNGDNLYPATALQALCSARGPAAAGFERDSLGLPPDRLGAFALLEPDARGCLSRIVEKPGAAAVEAAGPDALISMNIWRFDARIFEACRDVPVSPRGEKELPEAVGLSASRGVCFEIMRVRGSVIDVSRRSDVGPAGDRLRGVEVRL